MLQFFEKKWKTQKPCRTQTSSQGRGPNISSLKGLNNTLFRIKQSWNEGPRGYPYYRASYLTIFKYYLQPDKIIENYRTKKKEHAYDTI